MGWSRFLRRSHWDDERARELGSYLEIEIDEQIARGVPPAEARAAAVRKLGNPTRVREEIYEMNTLGVIEIVWQDLRHGLRVLRLNPAFATVALLSLALGIGANTALFQLVDAVSLSALPVTDPASLTDVRIGVAKGGRTGSFRGRRPLITEPLWNRVRDGQSSFTGLAAWGVTTLDLASGGESKPANAMWVSGDFFQVLDVRPGAGRLLSNADDARGCADPGVVISHRFWQREFGRAADTVGRTIRLDGKPLTVIGITPRHFFGLEVGRNFDVALPICAQPLLQPDGAAVDRRDVWWLSIVGRRRPGVTIEQATAELEGRSAAIFAETVAPDYDAETAEGYRAFKLQAFAADRGFSGLRAQYETPLNLLLAIAGLVLLIACANLANLMLARATAREREIAVRLAIGASRRRIVGQLMAESLLIAAIGAFAGFWLARALSQALVNLLASDGTPLVLHFATNWRVLGFTSGLAVATCLVFGLVPAIRATRTPPETVMRASGRGLTASRERFTLRRALVVGQIAVSLVLVAGSLLFARSFTRLADVDPGFVAEPVLRVDLDLRSAGVGSDQLLTYYEQVADRLRALPGVVAAGYADIVPMTGSGWNQRVVVNGERKDGNVFVNRVSPGYFETMQTPILAGRDVSARDTRSTPPVALVNELFAESYLGGGSVVGRRFRFDVGPGDRDLEFEVIGLVPNTKYYELREDDLPIVYVAAGQDARPLPFQQLLLRSAGAPGALRAPVTRAIAEVHPSILVTFTEYGTQVRDSLLRERLMAALSGGFAVLAITLASVGLYGLMAYSVARRRGEIGIRAALGATRGRIARMIAGETLVLVVLGVVLGLGLAVATTRAAATLLFNVAPNDPATLAVAALVLALTAGCAAVVPAVRAGRLQPVRALREE